ncbi:MAG: lipid II flippase MurJ [Phycisphaerae bacterium]|jgi:putative peptidoglycan lipid II flippase
MKATFVKPSAAMPPRPAMQRGPAAPATPVTSSTATSKAQHLGNAAMAVAMITVCAKICGFGEKVVVAHYFGASRSSDVYFAVTGILWSAMFLVKELIYPTLMPVFSGAMEAGGDRSRWLFRSVAARVLLWSGVAAAAAFAGAGAIVGVLLPGFDPAAQAASSSLLRALTPSFPLLALAAVTYTCLNARRRFAVSALGEMAVKLIIVLGLLALTPAWGLAALGPVVGVAAVACIAFHLSMLPEARTALGASPEPSAGDLRQMRRLMLPLVVGVVLSHANGLIDNLLASTLPGGQLSHLGYARKIIDAVILIGPWAVVTVVYAQMARLHADHLRDEMVRVLHKAARLLVYVSLPLACVLIELRSPLTQALLQRGRFDSAATAATSAALAVYAVALVTLALEGLVVYAFYAMSDTRTPVLAGAAFMAVDVGLSLALMQRWEYLGLAAAMVLAKSGKVAVLAMLLCRRLGATTGATNDHRVHRGHREHRESTNGKHKQCFPLSSFLSVFRFLCASVLSVIAVSSSERPGAGWPRFVAVLAGVTGAAWAAMHVCSHLCGGLGGAAALASLVVGAVVFVGGSHLLRMSEYAAIVEMVRSTLSKVGVP